MRFYYMLQPMMAVIFTISAAFLAGVISGFIVGRLAARNRIGRMMASRYNNALATLQERSKQESRQIQRLEIRLHAEKCRIAQISVLLGRAVTEANL